jgi:hypothetical protein
MPSLHCTTPARRSESGSSFVHCVQSRVSMYTIIRTSSSLVVIRALSLKGPTNAFSSIANALTLMCEYTPCNSCTNSTQVTHNSRTQEEKPTLRCSSTETVEVQLGPRVPVLEDYTFCQQQCLHPNENTTVALNTNNKHTVPMIIHNIHTMHDLDKHMHSSTHTTVCHTPLTKGIFQHSCFATNPWRCGVHTRVCFHPDSP